MTICTELNRLIALSRLWSVDEALWILWVYKCYHAEVCHTGFWTTPYKMSMSLPENRPAVLVKVKFFGGPSGTREHQGSLSMFVVDRVLRCWRLNDIGWAWLLKFNPDTTLHIESQLGFIKPGFGGQKVEQQKLLPGFEESVEYDGGERVVDYVQIRDDIYPILESGRQGCVVQRDGTDLPIRAVKSLAESDASASGNGRVSVYDGVS